ncbi:MAG TPA: carbon storage regulator [Planctomycetaceae bacterium]|nr:carbon storage regulator [Planctomycetaceae bacterium]
MLVLSRKEGEKLVIGDNISLVVSKISGNRVTLGIEAPADVKIFRGELADKANEEKQPKVVPLRRAATVTIDLESELSADSRQAM